MRLTRRGIAYLLAAALAAVVPIGSALAQEEALLDEDFDTPAPAGWEIIPGARVEGGMLILEGSGAAYHPAGWSGEGLEIRIQYVGPGVLLLSYAVTEQTRLTLAFDDGGVLTLRRLDSGVESEIAASAESVVPQGAWLDLSISVVFETTTIAIAGETVMTVVVANTPATGGLEFRVEGDRRAQVDSVRAVGSDSPPAATTTEGTTAAPDTGDRGGLGSLLDDFFGVQDPNIDVAEFSVNLMLAVLLSFILSRAYVLWGSALANRRRFAANFVLVAVTTTFIILVVRSSVALSLGLVGALSIVRFRAAVKDPEELAYMFLAVGIGIGLGDNQRLITILALAVCIAVIGLGRLFRGSRQADFNLHVAVAADGSAIDLVGITEALRPHCSRMRLSRYEESPSGAEAAFLAEFRDAQALYRARESLRALGPGLALTFLDDKGLV